MLLYYVVINIRLTEELSVSSYETFLEISLADSIPNGRSGQNVICNSLCSHYATRNVTPQFTLLLRKTP